MFRNDVLVRFYKLLVSVKKKKKKQLETTRIFEQFRGEGSGSQKQKTKRKLSSATPNRDKTIHCRDKPRKNICVRKLAAQTKPNFDPVASFQERPKTSAPNPQVGACGNPVLGFGGMMAGPWWPSA